MLFGSRECTILPKQRINIMATANTKTGMIELIEKGLEYQVKEVLEDRIMIDALKAYEDDLRPKIRKVVEQISLEGLYYHLKDSGFEEEIKVHWSEKVTNVIERS